MFLLLPALLWMLWQSQVRPAARWLWLTFLLYSTWSSSPIPGIVPHAIISGQLVFFAAWAAWVYWDKRTKNKYNF